jgi:hypothetical protein
MGGNIRLPKVVSHKGIFEVPELWGEGRHTSFISVLLIYPDSYSKNFDIRH